MIEAKIAIFLAVLALSPLQAFAQSAIPDGPPPMLGPPALGAPGPAQPTAPLRPPLLGRFPVRPQDRTKPVMTEFPKKR